MAAADSCRPPCLAVKQLATRPSGWANVSFKQSPGPISGMRFKRLPQQHRPTDMSASALATANPTAEPAPVLTEAGPLASRRPLSRRIAGKPFRNQRLTIVDERTIDAVAVVRRPTHSAYADFVTTTAAINSRPHI